jgi:hypothetical protein
MRSKPVPGRAECLVQWRGDPDSAAGRRLDRLYFEALQMWTAVQVGYPDRVKVGSNCHRLLRTCSLPSRLYRHTPGRTM